jgi:hypothetical protein
VLLISQGDSKSRLGRELAGYFPLGSRLLWGSLFAQYYLLHSSILLSMVCMHFE